MKVLKDLFGSKKGVACLAGLMAVVAESLGATWLGEEALLRVLGILAAFIVGQGLADIGKSAAEIAKPDNS